MSNSEKWEAGNAEKINQHKFVVPISEAGNRVGSATGRTMEIALRRAYSMAASPDALALLGRCDDYLTRAIEDAEACAFETNDLLAAIRAFRRAAGGGIPATTAAEKSATSTTPTE